MAEEWFAVFWLASVFEERVLLLSPMISFWWKARICCNRVSRRGEWQHKSRENMREELQFRQGYQEVTSRQQNLAVNHRLRTRMFQILFIGRIVSQPSLPHRLSVTCSFFNVTIWAPNVTPPNRTPVSSFSVHSELWPSPRRESFHSHHPARPARTNQDQTRKDNARRYYYPKHRWL